MDLRQLQYFVQVVEARNITRAADLLHIAQSALSQQILNLEADVGARLLQRTARGVEATRSGAILYRHARAIFRQVEHARSAVRDESEQPSGKVAIAMPSSTVLVVAAPLLCAVRTRFPAIRLEIMESPSADLPQLLLNGRLDMAIVTVERPVSHLAVIPQVVEDLFVITHPSLALRPPCSGAELARLPLILPVSPNCIRERVEAAAADAGMELNLVAEASTTSILVEAVRAGLCATVLPWAAASHDLSAGTVKATPLAGHRFQRALSLCVSNETPLSAAAEKVFEIASELLAELVASGRWKGARPVYAKAAA